MFLTDKIEIKFDGLEFVINVPNDDVLTNLWTVSENVQAEHFSPAIFGKLAEVIAPCVNSYPADWDNFPTISKNRLLFEIAKYILNESLTIPELKKK